MKYSNIMLEQTGQMQTDSFVILFTRKDVISRRRAPYTVSQKNIVTTFSTITLTN